MRVVKRCVAVRHAVLGNQNRYVVVFVTNPAQHGTEELWRHAQPIGAGAVTSCETKETVRCHAQPIRAGAVKTCKTNKIAAKFV